MLIQQLRRTQRHSRMGIVATGVHISVDGGKGKSRFFPNGQAIAVSTNAQAFARIRAAYDCRNTVTADLCADLLDPDLPQNIDDLSAGDRRIHLQLRTLMEHPAPGNDLVLQLAGFFSNTHSKPPSLRKTSRRVLLGKAPCCREPPFLICVDFTKEPAVCLTKLFGI